LKIFSFTLQNGLAFLAYSGHKIDTWWWWEFAAATAAAAAAAAADENKDVSIKTHKSKEVFYVSPSSFYAKEKMKV
jgi:hypothetical protein